MQGKRALITGGGGGIGRVMAHAYVREGATVLICGRNLQRLAAAAEGVDAKRLHYQVADLSREEDVSRLASWIEQNWGGLDILVNNAGVLGMLAPICDYPLSAWEEVMRNNLTSAFLVTKAMIHLMTKAGGGAVINLSSTVGRRGRAQWGAYAVSKFALEGFSQVLADELGPLGIRVNTVNPGGTRTSMRSAAYPEEDPGTLPPPEEIMPLFIYLASDASREMTGRALDARGWTLPA